MSKLVKLRAAQNTEVMALEDVQLRLEVLGAGQEEGEDGEEEEEEEGTFVCVCGFHFHTR